MANGPDPSEPASPPSYKHRHYCYNQLPLVVWLILPWTLASTLLKLDYHIYLRLLFVTSDVAYDIMAPICVHTEVFPVSEIISVTNLKEEPRWDKVSG